MNHKKHIRQSHPTTEGWVFARKDRRLLSSKFKKAIRRQLRGNPRHLVAFCFSLWRELQQQQAEIDNYTTQMEMLSQQHVSELRELKRQYRHKQEQHHKLADEFEKLYEELRKTKTKGSSRTKKPEWHDVEHDSWESPARVSFEVTRQFSTDRIVEIVRKLEQDDLPMDDGSGMTRCREYEVDGVQLVAFRCQLIDLSPPIRPVIVTIVDTAESFHRFNR